MPTYQISSDSTRVSVESDNWLYAIASALPQFGLEPRALDQLMCTMNPDGSVDVVDVVGDVRIRVGGGADGHAITLEMPRASMPIVAPAEGAELVPPPRSWGWDVEVATNRRTVALERSDEIHAATSIQSACNIALQIVTTLVGAESGAVLLRKTGSNHLTFIAAVGPSADRVIDTELPESDGIAGFSFTSGIAVVVQDVVKDGRFASQVDESSGYRTQSLLATPIRVVDGPNYGCLELLNAPDGFHPADLEIVRVIASALSGRLRADAE
ncbi:MAG: GAF domain-containing protein [Pseudomonadota bacterium]|nr:GAF domain-containing protein [Pseudomonadota bacterium]